MRSKTLQQGELCPCARLWHMDWVHRLGDTVSRTGQRWGLVKFICDAKYVNLTLSLKSCTCLFSVHLFLLFPLSSRRIEHAPRSSNQSRLHPTRRRLGLGCRLRRFHLHRILVCLSQVPHHLFQGDSGIFFSFLQWDCLGVLSHACFYVCRRLVAVILQVLTNVLKKIGTFPSSVSHDRICQANFVPQNVTKNVRYFSPVCRPCQQCTGQSLWQQTCGYSWRGHGLHWHGSCFSWH